MTEEYPQEFFIEITTDEYREGRITVNKLGSRFSSEIDIVQIETKKIWHHVGSFYNFSDSQSKTEVLETSVQYLSNFLRAKKA